MTGKRGFSSHCVLEQVKRGLANLLKHGAGFSRSSLAGVHRKLRDARGSKGRAVPAPIENDRFRPPEPSGVASGNARIEAITPEGMARPERRVWVESQPWAARPELTRLRRKGIAADAGRNQIEGFVYPSG